MSPLPAALRGGGKYAQQMVGESAYQGALERLCGGRTEAGHLRLMMAALVLEDENAYDSNAVRIEIEGECVGYLDRPAAKRYRRALEAAGGRLERVQCAARVRGGWERDDGDTGLFGVKLDLNLPPLRKRKPSATPKPGPGAA